MKEHPQAEILRAIADGHEHFEMKVSGVWETCYSVLSAIADGYEVRIAQTKPRVITGTLTVPEPISEHPKDDSEYWHFQVDGAVVELTWRGDRYDKAVFPHGIWRTREEATAARNAWQAFLRGGE
jgi:hypothetical protein